MKIVRPKVVPAVPKFEPFAVTVDTPAKLIVLRRATANFRSESIPLTEAGYDVWRVLDDEAVRQRAAL